MKTIFLLAFISIITFPVFSQSTNLFDDYKIPTYSFHTLQLSAQDFLNYIKVKSDDIHQDDENINVNFYLYDKFVKQSPFYTGITETNLRYSYNMEKRNETVWANPYGTTYKENKNERSQSDFYISSMNDFYPENDRGVFLSGNFAWSYDYYTPSNTFISKTGISIGGGYGRIVGMRTIVQAYIISKETGANLNDEDILRLAEVIERWSGGFYTKFKDNADIEFYKDVVNITRKPEQITKIQQILSSPVYKTAERQDGIKVKATIDYANIGGDNYLYTPASDLTNVTMKVEFAKPIGFNSQLYLSAAYTKNLNEKPNTGSKLSLLSRFSMDHSFTWSSSISLEFDEVSFKNENDRSKFRVNLSTNYAIINALTAYGSVEYEKSQFYESSVNNSGSVLFYIPDSETTTIHLGLKYYIF